MSHPAPARRPLRLARRAALGVGTALAVITSGLVAPAAVRPAYAADTFSCAVPANVFNSTTSGTLLWRKLSSPGSTASSWSAATTIGPSGWTTFGRILGGPDGRVYGINANGLTRYRWTGSGWELTDGKQAKVISSSFVSYASSTWRNKITVDELGDFYLVDNTGRLKWYRYDEPGGTWTINGRTIDTGWDRYDLIVAAGPGVIYGRQADGKLYRYRFDPVSQRWLDRERYVTAGWGMFTKGMFSAGGDTLFGIKADGSLLQYRYREDNNTWVVAADPIGTGWAVFPNVVASTNACRLTATFSPVRPATPTVPHSPVSAMQAPAAPGATLGTVEYAFVDNIGTVRHGRQTNPDDFGSIQWSAVDTVEASTGKPALVADSQKRVTVFAHQTNSDVRSLTQSASGAVTWNAWSGLGGAMRSEPSVVALTDGSLAVFALDADGALWVRPQDGSSGDLLPWTKLGGSGLTGNPVVTAGADGSATVTAVDNAGTVVTATYRNRALASAFTSIGGTGFAGTPAVVVMPGRRARVFARHTDGTIKSQYQNGDFTWSGTWTTVGTGDIIPAGTPSAQLDPNLGRILVVTRTADDSIYQSWETGQGTGTWGGWNLNGNAGAYPADPTIFSYQNSNGNQLAFVSRTVNSLPVLFAPPDVNTLARGTATTPVLTEKVIPQPKND
ncbi:tachylectin-related carbohydrate-binding protein [Micromonospora krabiensis]|uniref:Tachylectin n=1 Tax=Micromonospora krabiensis TaxID=307121 RepID=A0A1C3N136_9ACTN|nr:tachylectin-related carbohydrate-binding protein [Micromonospora krabiensis]SBV26275.1 Tachylectin [Micromonospora krabiensis]